MVKETIKYSAEGYHSRTNLVLLSRHYCDSCDEDKPILVFDNSDEEYKQMYFCKDCLMEMFNENHNR